MSSESPPAPANILKKILMIPAFIPSLTKNMLVKAPMMTPATVSPT